MAREQRERGVSHLLPRLPLDSPDDLLQCPIHLILDRRLPLLLHQLRLLALVHNLDLLRFCWAAALLHAPALDFRRSVNLGAGLRGVGLGSTGTGFLLGDGDSGGFGGFARGGVAGGVAGEGHILDLDALRWGGGCWKGSVRTGKMCDERRDRILNFEEMIMRVTRPAGSREEFGCPPEKRGGREEGETQGDLKPNGFV